MRGGIVATQLENDMTTKSSQKSRDQVLVLGVMSTGRAEKLLLDWANVKYAGKDSGAAYQRLAERYPEVVPEARPRLPGELPLARLFGELLRLAWDAPTPRKREWYLHDAESLYHHDTGRFGDPPTHATPLEAMLYHFRRNVGRALHCPNPDCVAPYFFSQKKGQKYCSDVCALPAQREAKRRWWRENKAK
jgi:hypothetical protein